MDDLRLHIEAEINPTEDEQKIKQAIENMFGPLNTRATSLHKSTLLTAETTNREPLSNLRNLLQREHVRAAARKVLVGCMERRSISFCLNKQVAYAGHVSFSRETGESPLGPIRITIEHEHPREIINWLTQQS